MTLESILGVVYAALLGGVLASFANVLIVRWHEGTSIMGRSECPQCKTQIRARHLVPIFSWLWLKGKCATCQRKIHFQYLLVEVAGALLGMVAALRFDPFDFSVAPLFWFEFIVTISLLVPVVMDIRWQELPVEYLEWLGAVACIYRLVLAPSIQPVIVSTIIALFAIVLFFGLQIIFSNGKWLGMGDVWFGVFMACVLGWPNIAVAVYVAYLVGGTVAIIGLLTGLFTRTSRLAFAPMLAFGVLITLWFGDSILRWISQLYA